MVTIYEYKLTETEIWKKYIVEFALLLGMDIFRVLAHGLKRSHSLNVRGIPVVSFCF